VGNVGESRWRWRRGAPHPGGEDVLPADLEPLQDHRDAEDREELVNVGSYLRRQDGAHLLLKLLQEVRAHIADDSAGQPRDSVVLEKPLYLELNIQKY